jgi:hypothetical protein
MTKIMGDEDFDELLDRCLRVLKVKGDDYTMGLDRLYNFDKAAAELGTSPMQVLAVYLHKHLCAVMNYVKTGGQAESEPIRERIVDCVNYFFLLHKLVKREQQKAKVAEVHRAFRTQEGKLGTQHDASLRAEDEKDLPDSVTGKAF